MSGYLGMLIFYSVDLSLTIMFMSCFLTFRDRISNIDVSKIVALVATVEFLGKEILGLNSLTFTITIHVIAAFILFKNAKMKVSVIVGLAVIFSITIELITIVILGSWDGFNVTSSNNSHISYIVFYMFYFFVKSNIAMVLKRFKKKRKDAENLSIHVYQVIIPIISCVGFYVMYMRDAALGYLDVFSISSLIIIFATINVVSYYVFEKNELLINSYAEQKLENEMYQYREKYYKKMNEYHEEIRILKHDYKNQLIAIYPYLNDSNLKTEIKTLLQQLTDMDKKYLYTQNHALNAILNQKKQTAEHYAIDCEFEVVFPAKVQLSIGDIGSLLGNLLDNAIEAVRECDDRRMIQLKILYYNKSITIEIQNSIKEKVEHLSSKKKNNDEHGFGTKSISKIVKKYNGEYEWNSTNQMFHTSIFIWDLEY